MKVCGIDLVKQDAIIAIIDGTKGSWKAVNNWDRRRISLVDDEDQQQVRNFRDAVNVLVRKHGIQRVAIKKRVKRGRFAGGAVSFKMEGLIQLVEMCAVIFVPPQTIARVTKEHDIRFPPDLQAYQRDAFNTAFTALDDH